MTHTRLMPTLAFVAAGITAAGLGLASVPAKAATAHHAVTPVPAPRGRIDGATSLTPSQLAQVRVQQGRLAAEHRSAPAFARAAAKTFIVDTTEDSDLAAPADVRCIDAATGRCSLRSAVDAANNLSKPVRILLGKHAYTLTSATAIVVSNDHGTSILGQGAGKTAVAGDGSGIFDVESSGGPGSLFLTSLELENGTAPAGGAVRLGDLSTATLSLDHVAAVNNSATGLGGAIDAPSGNAVYISHSTFRGNSAPQGGAIFEGQSDVAVVDSSFHGNFTPPGVSGYGGAVFSQSGVFDMAGGSISGNEAGDATMAGYGGGIYDQFATSKLSDVQVDHNTATAEGAGGAVFGEEDALEVDGGTMSHNHADGTASLGGALYAEGQAQEGLHGVTMVGNRTGANASGYGGGAIFAFGAAQPLQLVINHGTKITGSNNSAIYLYAAHGAIDASIADSTLSENHDAFGNADGVSGCGGAVCGNANNEAAINLKMFSDQVSGNSASIQHGSGAVQVIAFADSTATVALRKNTFAKNTAGAGGAGGAVGFSNDFADPSPISVRMSFNTFISNRAGTRAVGGDGGAFYAAFDVAVRDHGSSFTDNHTVGSSRGGAVFDQTGSGSGWFNRTTFTGNSAGLEAAPSSGQGGAVYVNASSGVTFDHVVVTGNRALEGAGIYGDREGPLVVENSTISGNTAGTSAQAGYGGGILAFNVLVVENSTLTGNRALSVSGSPGLGGAIYHGGRLGLRYSTVSGNDARQGGGVYGLTLGVVVGSIVSKNRTSSHGSEQDCAATSAPLRLTSEGGNVLGQKHCVVALQRSDKVSKRLHLGKLANNGGPTRTMAISAESPAVGRASYLVPTTDQRGHGRPPNHADSGAYELAKVKRPHH